MVNSLNANRGRNSRRGVTMIELLVVIAIIGALMAILLPSIMQSRQRALSMQCKSNLHQIGVAAHQGRRVEWGRGIAPEDLGCGVVISTYRCPADSGSRLVTTVDGTEQQARSNYAAVSGDGKSSGMSNTSRDDVTDGLSNTLEIGEQDSQPEDPLRTWCGSWAASCEKAPNRRRPDGTKFIDGFRSVHPENGVNFLLADGSVRFISDSIDLTVYHALSTTQGGEVVGQY